MVMNNLIANALNILHTYDKLGKNVAVIKPVSKILIEILTILKDEGYIGDFTVEKNKKGGSVTVNLLGKINKCAAISPKFPVQLVDYETRERQYLPAKGFGILIVTTPQGIMKHTKATDLHVGGQLLAYCY